MEKLLWSIALPGFGQILNGEIAKGLFFIFLELIVNVKANLNNAIIYSFYGNTTLAVAKTDYAWLMFYPCLYTFAIWDAYKNSTEEVTSLSFLPFVFAAYLGTIGVIYSRTFRLFGVLLGPIWLPIICFLAGSLLGGAVMIIIKKFIKKPLVG